MLIKKKSTSLSRNLVVGTFGELLIVSSTKVDLLCLLYSTAQRCCLSTSDKVKFFAKKYSSNSILDDLGISLLVFPSRTNRKLHNISVTPMMVKKVITNLESSKTSGPDCIPLVFLKK